MAQMKSSPSRHRCRCAFHMKCDSQMIIFLNPSEMFFTLRDNRFADSILHNFAAPCWTFLNSLLKVQPQLVPHYVALEIC